MSFNKDKNNDLTPENMKQEDKVNFEEVFVNVGCVKKELCEEELEFKEKQYKISLNFENIFGESSIHQKSNRNGLIGFLDGDVIMETGSVKLEDVREENKDIIRQTIGKSDCNRCGGNYQGYCLNCPSLSHILNNLTPNLNLEPVLNTTPINMLQIREVSMRRGVFALKTLPKGIILGPFEGVAPIESTTGLQWKIKDQKFVNDQNGNWMKYIESVANHASKNLHVFQFDAMLYFETCREIQEGEELIVCYGVEEEVLKLDKDEEFYLIPVKKEEYPKVFACTRCCLGFRLESCLVEHKSKCPQEDHGCNIEDFEIIQCRCCKVWLEKREYLEGHVMYCLENYNRLGYKIPDFQRKPADEIDEIQRNRELSTPIDENRSYLTLTDVIHTKWSDGIGNKKGCGSEKKHKCSECSYQTNRKSDLIGHLNTHKEIKPFECDVCKQRFCHKNNLKKHVENKHSNTHKDVKPFECGICKKRFNHKGSLKSHIKDKHSNASGKEYKCPVCPYQTNHKGSLRGHLNTHNDIKSFECDICKKKFKRKADLNMHTKNQHSNTLVKEYKCPDCSYQTNNKSHLKIHFNAHIDIKPFECDICKNRFTQKSSLKLHTENKHSNRSEMEYKCSVCSYQTNHKVSFNVHLNTHNDIKPFVCDICKKRFTQKSHMKQHLKYKHLNTSEKEYKCSECSYQTNYKSNLKEHLNTHDDIKPFECNVCKMRFTQKKSIKRHIQNIHLNIIEKKYKCSECSYETIHKGSLKGHLNTHNDIKSFVCDFCKKKFKRKVGLKLHVRNQHLNTDEKDYKCSQCSYQTNYKSNLNEHVNTHKNIKAFACGICKKRFTLKKSIKKHIQDKHSSTSDKKYERSECSNQTNHEDSLELLHLHTHYDIKPDLSM